APRSGAPEHRTSAGIVRALPREDRSSRGRPPLLVAGALGGRVGSRCQMIGARSGSLRRSSNVESTLSRTVRATDATLGVVCSPRVPQGPCYGRRTLVRGGQ